MDMKLERLNSGERIAAGSALALFVCMFFGWFNFGFDTFNAWEALHYISPILTIAIAFTLGVALMKASGRSLGDVPDRMAIFVLGCLATILVLFRLIDPVSSSSAEAGMFLGLLAAAGIVVGGYLATGGTALDQVKAMVPSAGPTPFPPQAAPPPPPPPSPPAPPPPAPVAPPPAPVASPPTPLVADGGAFCEECGAALTPGDRFCSDCGKQQAASPG
jgi:hypothetical protein